MTVTTLALTTIPPEQNFEPIKRSINVLTDLWGSALVNNAIQEHSSLGKLLHPDALALGAPFSPPCQSNFYHLLFV